LLVVIGVFSILQYGGLFLVPGLGELLGSVRTLFGRVLDRPMSEGLIEGQWLILVSIVAFYVSGLCDYGIHRFVSHSRYLWFTHEYHHLPRKVSVVMPGIAGRPFAVVAVFPTITASVVSVYGVLVLCGLPLWDLSPLKVLLIILAFVQSASHSSFLRHWWWVHHAMKCLALTTPQEHVLHHTVDLRGNYGNFTTLWDRIFGTYLDPAQEQNQGHRLGLAYDQDFLGTITLGKLKLSGRLRRRFDVGRYCNIAEREETV
jgi:sterol desaturase/sphingolipid hydroxylase (fatty acid hydroxylase superfamily)